MAVPRLSFAKPRQTPFVKRVGSQLVAGGIPWKVYGGSNYGTLNPGAQGTIAGTTTLAIQARLNTVRLVNFFDERGLDGNAAFNEASWRRVDAALDSLKVNGLRAILDLSVYRNHLQNLALNTGSTMTPYSADWSKFIRFAATRMNTVNRLRYKNDPTIAIVSFAGEPNPPNSGEPLKPTTQELTDFYRRVFAQWRAIDPNHLLSPGGLLHLDWEERYGNPSGSGVDWQAIFALDLNDVPAIHNYSLNATPATDFTSPKIAPYCAQIGKPWITEEFGFKQFEDDQTRSAHYQAVYDIQAQYGSAGVAFWNLGNEVVPPGVEPTTFDVNPNTPLTWAVVQANAPAS
ncbi:MAG: cellulase family glycosylhydrolase [Actinomycetota bacterium]